MPWARSAALGLAAVLLALGVAPPAVAADARDTDPLANYFGNTLVCAAAMTGNDLCHLWLKRDGTFIIFDLSGGHAGHYDVGPLRPDGKVPVCLRWDTTNMVMPPELRTPMPQPPRAPGEPEKVLLCKTEQFHTTCQRVDPATLSPEDRKIAARNMGERFHAGMCYPLGPHKVGDVWFEEDVPLPGQLGKDKLLLLGGHR